MILHTDSFDNYATVDIVDMYTQIYGEGTFATPTIGAYGRRGTQGLQFAATSVTDGTTPGPVALVIPNTETRCGIGFAGQFVGSFGNVRGFTNVAGSNYPSLSPSLVMASTDGSPVACLAMFRAAALTQIAFGINRDGTLSVGLGSGEDFFGQHERLVPANILGTTSNAFLTDTYYYIELAVTSDGAAGAVDIIVNGDVWLSLSGVPTVTPNAPSYIAEIVLGRLCLEGFSAGDLALQVDDYVIWNTDASDPVNTIVDFMGDVDLTYIPPVSDDVRGWTPLSGIEHYEMVNEIPPDGDTTYNYTDSVGAVDTFFTSGAPLNVDILALTVVFDRRRTTGGNTSTTPIWRLGGVNYDRGAIGDPTTYAFREGTWSVNPATLGAITKAVFDASSVGYKKVT